MGKESKRAKFSAKKATRNTLIQAGLGAVLMGGVAAAAEFMIPGSSTSLADLWPPVADAAWRTAASSIPVCYAGEYISHRLDDPTPVFDRRTTILFHVTGLLLCFLLFVVPALQLDHAIRESGPLPGLFGYFAFLLSVFLVTILRGLLCNLGLAREEDVNV